MTAAPAAHFTAEGVFKAYGAQPVLCDLSAGFAAGECALLLGANGAGKSTLLRICAGLLRADRGRVTLNGKVPRGREVGYFGHQALLYGALTLEENLRLIGSLTGSSERVAEELAFWELDAHRHKPINELSKGLQSRAALARTFLHRPPLLLLDEPTSALDEHALQLLLEALKRNGAFHAGRACSVIATHDLARLKSAASRIVILQQGRIAADSQAEGADRERVIARYLEANR